MEPLLLTVEEAAATLKIGRTKLYELKSQNMAKRYARVNPVELHDQIRTLEELPSYDDPAA